MYGVKMFSVRIKLVTLFVSKVPVDSNVKNCSLLCVVF